MVIIRGDKQSSKDFSYKNFANAWRCLFGQLKGFAKLLNGAAASADGIASLASVSHGIHMLSLKLQILKNTNK